MGFGGKLGEAFGRSAAGLVRAENVGVATRGGFLFGQCAIVGERGFFRREGEAVIRFGREKYGQHAVSAFLVNETGDEIAEANTVADDINAVTDLDFQHGELATPVEAHTAQLD